MSAFLDFCSIDICRLLIHGYCRIETGISIEDICTLIIHFGYGSNSSQDKKRVTQIEYAVLSRIISIFSNKSLHELFILIMDNLIYTKDTKDIFNSSDITNEQLSNSIWRIWHWCQSLRDIGIIPARYTSQNVYLLILNEMINTLKDGSKYKHFDELIRLYQFYYFDLYILKFIKSELKGSSSRFRKEFDDQISKQIQSEITIDFDEWSNDHLLKMNDLLQKLTVEYSHDVDRCMEELNDITNMIAVKYKFIQLRLNRILMSKQWEFGFKSLPIPMGNTVRIVKMGTKFLLICTLLAATLGYKLVSGDGREWVEILGNTDSKYLIWIISCVDSLD